MDKVEISFRMTGLAVGTAMAGVLLAGCTTAAAPRADLSAASAETALAEGRTDRAVRLAEQAVEADPHNASHRALLGKAYLDAGRFASAQASFDDAMALGDLSPRTALSLALTLTAQAKYTEAAALLNDWEGHIATADLGLALALSGQPERGIHLMSNAIRGGDNTVKMRQNLAYAYAVAGRWRESRAMAAMDVPAGEVGNRMEQWAAMASPDAYQYRVARLLGVPAGVSDGGQPVHLALGNTPNVNQLAAEATALAAAPVVEMSGELPAVPAALASATPLMAVPVQAGELPSVGAASLAPATFQPREAARPASFAQAFAPETGAPVMNDAQSFAAPTPVAAATAALAPSTALVSVPAAAPSGRYAQPRVAGQAAARATAAATPAAAPAGRTAPVTDGSHLVQLGSFSSEQAARRAWGIYVARYPELADHEMVITQANVRGRHYFRVSAGGFDRTASRSMCGRVNSTSSDGCISWAAASPLPGALPARADNGTRLARR
ncbi:tetratricopeptide repeat protein [Altererythrobacter sp. KTW20L]|uniref:SPOR domain-containing protein n=1 Tax=Altererythrobacter sp. KTW20L TaxID=2942210 RepID=UPI0020BED77F|nr:SPOR domain-containing protein [Altererythrobacter sp. KTW20L]MCL6250912.1 tetratricopeptide repeat protein [Altererythrobacter sp. KTW20L]